MEFLTTMDAARLLNRSPETVRLYERRGQLPAIRTAGGQRLFRRKDVEKFAREKNSLSAETGQ